MKKTILKLFATTFLFAGGLMISCSDDDNSGKPVIPDDKEETKVELPSSRMFIMNEGLMGMNNANISFYSPVTKVVIDDIYYIQNSRRLGDTAEDMIEDDGYIYVAVTGSNYLARLNSYGMEEKRVSFVSDADLQGGIRSIVEEDNYIYASFHGGVVAKISKDKLEIEKKLSLGSNLEGMAVEDDKLYVANSYSQSLDPETGMNTFIYHDQLFLIDLKSFALKETLTVAVNPNDMCEEDDKIFLISSGNYADKGYDFQMIDPKQGNKVTSIAVATDMAPGNDRIYLVNSVTDWTTYTTTNSFFYYDIKGNRLVETSFLQNPPTELASAIIYMITVDDYSGDIYIATTDYTTNGEIYRFGASGNFIESFDAGGLNPSKAVFINRKR